MRIYHFYPDGEKAVSLVPADLDYFEEHFVGKRMTSTWKPPTFEVLRKSRPLRDFISWFGSAMILTSKAKSAIEQLITPHVEFLPFVELKGHKLYAVNVIEVLDCLNRKASHVTFSSDDSTRVIHIEKFAFIPQRLKKVPIFKVPERPQAIFVSEEFAQVVVKAKLKGAGFDNPEDIRYVKSPWNGTMSGLPAARDYLL